MAEEQPGEFNKWQGLVRASILSATTHKLYRYIGLADQKAMGLIVLNSIIVPVAMNSIHDPHLMIPATIAIFTSIISIFTAIMCIFPKRWKRRTDGNRNLLHFSDIGKLSEDEYLALMQPIYNDRGALGVEVLKDLHDVSHRVLIPKFTILKYSYIVFFTGNLIAVLTFLVTIWL